VAISAIELLKSFMHLSGGELAAADKVELAWKVGIHLTFVLSGVLFVLMDWPSEEHKSH